MSNYEGISEEVVAEVRRSIAKHGYQRNVPLGTGDQVPFLHGETLPKPHEHVPVTMGTLAYIARNTTDAHSFSEGDGTVTWADILLEEVAESFAEDTPTRVREEMVQVAAVAFKIIAAIDARLGKSSRADA